nr:hypothetical protein [Tanacetum cinerariifolium]
MQRLFHLSWSTCNMSTESVPALLLDQRGAQHAHAVAAPPALAPELQGQVVHLPGPAAGDHDAADDVDEADDEGPEAAPLLDEAQ